MGGQAYMSREDGTNQIRSMNREQEDGWWETQDGKEQKEKQWTPKPTPGLLVKTERRNLSQEKEAVAEQKDLSRD